MPVYFGSRDNLGGRHDVRICRAAAEDTNNRKGSRIADYLRIASIPHRYFKFKSIECTFEGRQKSGGRNGNLLPRIKRPSSRWRLALGRTPNFPGGNRVHFSFRCMDGS